MDIKVIDRETKHKFVEIVPYSKGLVLMYNSKIGKASLNLLFKRKLLSRILGFWKDSHFSRREIFKFAHKLSISDDECIRNFSDFKTFNEFFIRKLKPGARPIIKSSNKACMPADGRILVFPKININHIYQVKNSHFKLDELLGSLKLADKYKNGSYAIIRLAPADYHRFHFPVDGYIDKTDNIKGHYYSVSPLALEKKARIFCNNKRTITQIKSDKFGKVLYLEVAATFVGSIKQTYKNNTFIKKGDEKGFFKFGGSTVILLFEKGKIKFSKDLIAHSKRGIETLVKMGEELGSAPRN